MIRRLTILLLIVGCSTEPEDCAGVAGVTAEMVNCNVCDSDSSNDNTTCTQDCAGEWGGDAVSSLVGDIDGDGYITGVCCEQTSCQNNPSYNMNLCPENTAVGDIGALTWLGFVEDGLGCNGWDEGEAAPFAEDCSDFYWIDLNGDGGINSVDITCLSTYFDTDSSLCKIPTVTYNNNPCAGKYIGEECCVAE